MKFLVKLLKGIAIGIANVIPGFSSGTMALMLNIYDEFVSAFADIVKHPIQVIKKSGAIFVGMLIGIVLALFTVVKLLEVALFPTIFFFIGLVLGIVPDSCKKVDLKSPRLSYAITLVLTIGIIVGLPLLNENNIGNIDVNFFLLLIIVLMGILSASAMVLPGISGSMILMVFGYYTYIIATIKDAVVSLIGFDMRTLLISLLVLLCFLVGVVIGVILVSKLVRKIYTKHENLFNIGVLGLLFASPIAIIIASNKEYDGALFQCEWWMYLIGVFTLVGGVILSLYGESLNKKFLEVADELEAKDTKK